MARRHAREFFATGRRILVVRAARTGPSSSRSISTISSFLPKGSRASRSRRRVFAASSWAVSRDAVISATYSGKSAMPMRRQTVDHFVRNPCRSTIFLSFDMFTDFCSINCAILATSFGLPTCAAIGGARPNRASLRARCNCRLLSRPRRHSSRLFHQLPSHSAREMHL